MKNILHMVLLGCFALSGTANANLITNGSLTGPIANAGVPSGWTTLAGSPDTMDETNNVGAFVPFGATPSGPSPDGGTWVGFAAAGSFYESFGQTVTGLSVGTGYDLSWYAGNFGARTGVGYTDVNAVEVFIDGLAIGSGDLLNLGPDWLAQSLSFTATSSSIDLSFRLLNTDASYLSIDGISLVEAGQSVPEPATLALLGIGLAGIGFQRKRRLTA